MDIKKILLYIAVALLGVMIWTTWQKDYPPSGVKQAQTSTAAPKANTPENFTPPTFQSNKAATSTPSTIATRSDAPVVQHSNGNTITVTTDVLKVEIGEKGGNLVGTKLLKYPVSLKEKNVLVSLFSNEPGSIFIAQSGITNGINSGKISFQTQQTSYTLQPDEKTLTVKLTGSAQNGLSITKTYRFEKGSYAIKENLKVTNRSSKPWKGSVFHQFTQKNGSKHSFFNRSYTGAAISSPEEPYEKLSYKSLSEQNVDRTITNGWIAMQVPYFLGAWVPARGVNNRYYSRSFGQGEKGKGNTFILGYVGPQKSLAPGQSISSDATVYAGPELAKQLNALAPHLSLTIDYGWLWFLSKPIFWVMSKIHSFVGNWGWSIVLVTLLIKILFSPLSAKSFKSMAKMREVAPRLAALKERYADDKQALGKATMEFYKKEKVNPAGGCLLMLVQIPVFIALYYVLIESVQLRQAPFIFWIHDLSIKDPYYVLPVLMGLSMFVQQKLSPPPADPTQAKMMMFLPVVFTFFFLHFPAGLVLYWLTNNCLTIIHQWYVIKTHDPKAEAAKKANKKRKKKKRR